MFADINLLAVLVAGIVPMVVGMLWYGKPLFMEQWMKLTGMTKADLEKSKPQMPKMYALSFGAALVTAFVTAIVVNQFNATTLFSGVQVGFLVWLGFIATSFFTNTLYTDKPMKLYSIDTGYHLVNLVIIGALFAVWQ